ncbi:MAG TPA: MXAN_2562 family outer membrane beta-barrel protein [Kofleriaceae bacterium]
MKRLLILALLCLGSAVANAQTMSSSLPDGSTLSFVRIYLHEGNSQTLVQPKQLPNSLWNYFNYAHCVCSQANAPMISPFYETTFGYLIQPTNVMNAGELQALQGQVWVGTDCSDASGTTDRQLYCHQITNATFSIADAIKNNGVTPEIPVNDMMEPESNTAICPLGQFCLKPCEQRVFAANEWVGVITMGGSVPDYWVNQEVDTDSQPPPTPTSITANGSENGILLTWQAPIGNVSDIAYYQALCSDDAGNPAFTNSPFSARYSTPRTLCGAASDPLLVPCNFLDPENPNTCSAAATSTTVTDGGIADAPPDAFGTAIVRQADMDAGVDAAILDAPDGGTDVDAGTDINLQAIIQAPPSYICGEVTDATSTSLQIQNLQNNVNYTVALLAIDKYGNAAGVYINKVLTPKPVTDFWQDIHDKGSKVEGGFCLLAETYGDDNPLTNKLRQFRDHTLADTVLGRAVIDAYYATLGKLGAVVHGHWTLRVLSGIVLAPLVVFALLWHYLTLPGMLVLFGLLALRRRVMKSRLAARVAATGAMLFVLVGAPARAHAQSPYWENQTTGTEDDGSTSLADELSPVKWHVGVRLGPYTPQIDSQSTTRNACGQGPYEAMFGGHSIMPMLDVDRFLWTGYGQLGVGISAGYMGKSANAYVIPSDPSDCDRQRSPGDTTAFRMIPLQLTAVYRFTVLDDDYGIPIVPYVRGGFGYYVWWSTVDGHLSHDDMVSGSSIGASAGLVGTVGIAIRAERIDASAARAMREGGIQHAGFYAELNAGWVDGFGKATKLDVGDTTWFAGIDLEF